MRAWYCILLFVFFCSVYSTAQNTIGIPSILTYNKQIYKAGSQTWGMTQDAKGLMYFANNEGLVTFDGTFWRTYPLPNKTIARSIAIDRDNRIYIGGQGEIGYFFPGKNGDLQYVSLNKLLPDHDNDFADVWRICIANDHVFFRSNKKIFEYTGTQVKVYDSENWSFMGFANHRLIANQTPLGLVEFKSGKWVPIPVRGSFPPGNILIRNALPLTGDSILLATLGHGLFILHHDTLTSFTSAAINDLSSRSISSACMISENRIAISTNLAGVIIIDKSGNFIQHFTREEGIQNNNVLSVFLDRNRNLWLGLDNGIDLVAYSNAIRNIFPDPKDRNAGYTSAIHDNRLYLGVSTGVYSAPLVTSYPDLSDNKNAFEFVSNTEGQVWSLSSVNGRLMMGHNKGAFTISGNSASAIDTRIGFWGFQPLYMEQPSSMIVAGTYNGISFATYSNNTMSGPVINSQVESARYIAIGRDKIWIAHPYKGLFNIRYDREGIHEARKYPDPNHILSTNHNLVFKVSGRIILSTDKGIFVYDESKAEFEPATFLTSRIGNAPVSYIREDRYGNIWYCRDKKVSVLEHSSSGDHVLTIPEIDGKIMANGFEHINVIDSNNVLIAAEHGFYHINFSNYKKNRLPLDVIIRKVEVIGSSPVLIYGGFGPVSRPDRIPYKNNSIHLEYSSTLFGQQSNIEYSFLLDGFDQEWSAWTSKTEKDYTNLSPGTYTFRVKCRNNPENISIETVYSFTIRPPWYRTTLAYIIYILLLAFGLYAFYKGQQSKYKRIQKAKLLEQQRKYDEEQKKLELEHQLAMRENEKQIIELTNEKLQAEVDHKNTELASSAMNLVQKKEMLSRIKSDLLAYKEHTDPTKANKEFQKIVRLIDKELDQNQDWEQFAVHFDSIHTNYLKKLKERYPGLTTSDLKLAAYLRLNLSTKEIAQLLNISVRGVETSRYRLRKKLGLEIDENLFDHLSRIA